MAKVTVQQYDMQLSISLVTDSSTGIKLDKLDTGYTALVTEVTDGAEVSGTILYIPGVPYKTLKKGQSSRT